MDHIVTDNLKTNKYQSNESINNGLTFDTSNFNLSSGNSNPLLVLTVSPQGGKKHRETTVAGLTLLWDSRATDIIIKRRHTKNHERKMRSNKVDYSTASGMYCMTHGVKVPFCMPKFSSSKIINHRFHGNNDKSESGIGYYMVICRDLVVHLGIKAYFKSQVLQWYVTTVHINEPISFLEQSDLTKRNMREVVIQAAEPASTRKSTERIVKILDITYAKEDLKQVADNSTQINAEERTLLLSLLEDS